MDCHSEPDRTIFTVRSAAKNLRHRWGRFFTPLRSVQNDTFHLVRDKKALLQELHRVLKPGGFLSADHMHTAEDDFLDAMQVGGFFSFQSQKVNDNSIPITHKLTRSFAVNTDHIHEEDTGLNRD